MYRLLEARHISEGFTKITRRPLTAIRLLQNSGLLNANYLGLFHNLRAMRNAVAYTSPISRATADAVFVMSGSRTTSQKCVRRLLDSVQASV